LAILVVQEVVPENLDKASGPVVTELSFADDRRHICLRVLLCFREFVEATNALSEN
jgi:hypothetical protein